MAALTDAQTLALKALLDVNHPVSGPWDANVNLAAKQANAFDMDGPGGVEEMLEYIVTHKNRTNTGTDTTGTIIAGRMQDAANASVDDDPFGSGTLITLEHKHAAMGLLIMLQASHLGSVNFQNTDFSTALDAMVACGVMKLADANALRALSDNKRSLMQANNLPRIGGINVEIARALP